MKKNSYHLNKDIIDFIDLIRIFWKKKVLILTVSIAFGLLTHFFLSNKNTRTLEYEFKIKHEYIKKILMPYASAVRHERTYFYNFYISELDLHILSRSNLKNFLKKNKEFSDNIDLSVINLKKSQIKDSSPVYIYSRSFKNFVNLDDISFIKKYLDHTANEVNIKTQKFIEQEIIYSIYHHNNALEQAKELQLELPLAYSQIIQNLNINSNELYQEGSRLLAKRIYDLNNALKKLESENFIFDLELIDDNILIEQGLKSTIYFFLGFFLSFLVSFVIIFFKNSFKK
jgi:hypothetical protein